MRRRCVLSLCASASVFSSILSPVALGLDINIRCIAIDPEVHQELRVLTWQQPVPNSSTDKAMMADLKWISGTLSHNVYELADDVVKYPRFAGGPKVCEWLGRHIPRVHEGSLRGARNSDLQVRRSMSAPR